jgi:hypothetical protein
MSIRIDVTKGTVKKDLAELPEKMLDYAFEVLIDRARLMQGIAQVLVRVDTGSLRDSIRIERVAPSHHHHRVVRVRAGGYVTNPKTGKIVNYAVVVESKYPFLKPAYYQVRDTIKEMIKTRVVEGVST